MRDALDPQTFDPNYAKPGMVVRFDAIYNRAGWDYGSRQYDFAMRYDGVVFGGVFAPEVLKALEYAWYDLKLSVTDRITWDIVGVIEAADKIGERTQVTLRDSLTGREIGKLEEWPLIDCLRIRIIGLHAGPVAVTTPA